jgi:hypothetical protein
MTEPRQLAQKWHWRIWRRVAQSVGMTTAPLTSQQAADALRVHRATVHRWVSRGLLEPLQVIHLHGDEDGAKVYLFDPEYIAELAARAQSA